MNVVSKFLKGKWMEKARGYASNPQRLKILLLQLGGYLSKNGLSSAKETLVLMKNYLYDISTGRYKGYDIKKLSIVPPVIPPGAQPPQSPRCSMTSNPSPNPLISIWMGPSP